MDEFQKAGTGLCSRCTCYGFSVTGKMDPIDQDQDKEINALKGQDRVHTLLIKIIAVGFFAIILIITILFHIILTQKIYIEAHPFIQEPQK